MKQTVVVRAGAKNGKPWAAKVLAYEEGKKPVLEFGRPDGPVYGTFKDRVIQEAKMDQASRINPALLLGALRACVYTALPCADPRAR